MSALPCSSMPSVSRRYAVTRGAPGGSDSTRSPSSSVRRCFSPASWRWRPRASTRSTSETSGGVSRQAWAARSIARRVAPARGRRGRRGVEASSRGPRRRSVVASARWRARRCSSATSSASLRCTLALLLVGRLLLGRSGEQRVGGPDPVALDDDHARVDRRLQGRRRRRAAAAGRRAGRRRARGPAARGGRSRRGRRPAGPAGPRRGRARAGRRGCRGRARQRPAHLQHEQRVAHRGVVDPPQQVVGEPQPQPRGQELPGRAEADRRRPSSRSACSSGNAFSSAVRRPGRRASRNVTGSRSSRRAAYASASSDARSSHCTSSTATSSGPSSASARSAESTAIEMTWGSGGRSVGSAR